MLIGFFKILFLFNSFNIFPFIYTIKRDICVYVPYSRPNGWTEWADFFLCGYSWVGQRLKERFECKHENYNIFVKFFFTFNILFNLIEYRTAIIFNASLN